MARSRKRGKGRSVQPKKEEWELWEKDRSVPIGRRPKLSDHDKKEVIKARLHGAPVDYLAFKYDCCKRTIYRVKLEEVAAKSQEVRNLIRQKEEQNGVTAVDEAC